MKIVGVIPARYASTRFPGKPLADICGKPMIWWVYQQAKKVEELDEVYVATDDERIETVCHDYKMDVIMTSDSHPTHLDRLGEFAKKVKGDFYININGDEPLIDPNSIRAMLPSQDIDPNEFYFANGMMYIENPIEAIDTSKIKIATDVYNNCLYMARVPIPYPKGGSNFKLKKFVGIQCATRKALIFCSETKRGELESIEDIDEFRFIENGKNVKFILTEAKTIAVDTQKDLEKVRQIITMQLAQENAENSGGGGRFTKNVILVYSYHFSFLLKEAEVRCLL